MVSFYAKIDWIRLRKRENKNYRSVSFLLDALQKISKKKIQKNLKNTIMASFQTKIGWKWMRNRKNKNFNSISFLHDAQKKILKKQQKNCKN